MVMLGIDRAGKTILLYQKLLGEVVTTIPTIGFNVETVVQGNTSFTTCEVGGQPKNRHLWRNYYGNTSGVIFVVDSADTSERIDTARDELAAALKAEELKGKALLVYANKQDLPNAISPNELAGRLALHGLARPWTVIGCSALTGQGVDKGFEWLAQNIRV